MERLVMSNSSSSMKDYSYTGGGSNTRSPPPPPSSSSSSWNCTNSTITTTSGSSSRHHHQHPDYLSGFTWPPRSYTCSFCKREFRSAQALGGHMNVHRRDRARLRHYSPPPPPPPPAPPLPRDGHLNLNANPNPNPNHSTTFNSNHFSSSSSSPPSPAGRSDQVRKWASINEASTLLIDPPDHHYLTKVATRKSLFGIDGDHHQYCDHGSNKFRKRGGDMNVSLDLEIGSVVTDSKKEQLDLELRLGI